MPYVPDGYGEIIFLPDLSVFDDEVFTGIVDQYKRPIIRKMPPIGFINNDYRQNKNPNRQGISKLNTNRRAKGG